MNNCILGFPGGSDGKEPACNARDLGLISGLGRSPGGGHGYPLQDSCPENFMDMDSPWRISGGPHLTTESESVMDMGGQEGSTGESGPWKHGMEVITTTEGWGITGLGYCMSTCISSAALLLTMILRVRFVLLMRKVSLEP